MRWANLAPFMPVLVLITRVIHWSTLHFAIARNIVFKRNTREKSWQVESVEHIEQYHIKFVETSHYLKRRGRKALVESFILAVIICITEQRFRTLFHLYFFFLPMKFFSFFLNEGE